VRYHCGGWLKFTVIDDNDLLVRIRITHAEAHPPFPDGAGRRKAVKDGGGESQDNGGWAADSSSGDGERAGGGFIQDDYEVEAPLEVEPEVYEEPRVSSCPLYHLMQYGELASYQVFFPRERLASLRSNFDLMLEMAEEGVPPERTDSFRFVFDAIERADLDIRTVSAESSGERSSKRRRAS
jgi:hypothetical protein